MRAAIRALTHNRTLTAALAFALTLTPTLTLPLPLTRTLTLTVTLTLSPTLSRCALQSFSRPGLLITSARNALGSG